jgi:hypothetical protein
MLRNWFFIGSIILLSATGANAQQREVAQACAADIKSHCAGVQAGGGRIRACIKEHFSELSPSCQDGLTKVAAVGKACAADIKKSCAGVAPGGGAIAACAKSHLAEFSEPCKAAMTLAAAGRK